MKRKLMIFGLILTLVALPLVAACAKPAPAPAPAPTPAPAPAPAPAPTPAPAPPSAEKFTWLIDCPPGASTADDLILSPYPRFQKMIEEATGGRLTFETKIGMFPVDEVISPVKDGRIDVAYNQNPYTSGTFPLWNIDAFPLFFENVFEYEAAMLDPRIIEIMEKSYEEDAGVVKLCDISSFGQSIFSNKPLRTVEDLKGIKIRTSGMLMTFGLQLLGAAPLTMSMYEVAEAVQRGTVDAVATSSGFGLAMGMPDVTEYFNQWTVASCFAGAMIVNKESWNALPSDLQEIVKETARELGRQTTYGAWVQQRTVNTSLEHTGMTIIVPDKAEIAKATALMKPVYDKWLSIAGPYGPEVLAIVSKYASGALK